MRGLLSTTQAGTKLSSQINVFQLGKVMYHATTLETSGGPLQTGGLSTAQDARAPHTAQLKDLIGMCLLEDPADRPTPLALYKITSIAAKSCLKQIEPEPEDTFGV